MCSGTSRRARMPPCTLRVQRLHAAVEHLGEAGDLGDVRHREPGLAQRRGGAAGGDDLDAELGQAARELHQRRSCRAR